MSWQVTIPPSEEPLTIDEAKAQCRVDSGDEDTLMTSLILAARRYCEKIDWRAYVTQTLELWLDAWPADVEFFIPRPPLQTVNSIVYYDTTDVAATWDAADYFVDAVSQPGRVALRYNRTWPTTTLRPTHGICVTYVAGYGMAVDVPQEIKQAMLLLVGHWFENREASTLGAVSRAIEFAVDALLGVDRAFRF